MPVRNLSGGNQQRLVARREMRIASRVLIAAYPSRGLDVGAINTMLRYFVELRDQRRRRRPHLRRTGGAAQSVATASP